MNRVVTGVAGLDDLVEGGFPRGNLIVVSGPPGSGKTIFTFQFLYEGILKHGEVGLYVSFLENKSSFYSNFEHLGFDVDALDKSGRFNFMSLLTTKEEAVADSLKLVINEIMSKKVTLLVVDSFTAMRDAFHQAIDARIILNSILGKMVRHLGCTTLLIVEKSREERIGLGMEEFVSDGIVNLESFIDNQEIRRRLLITKMRGTNHTLKYQNVFIGAEGIRVAPLIG
ncbi:MAG: AAA family ATPase [Thaumarchaeota archaeon]|nr:AAA family ATPase [Nitrososphaerota archaeon]